MGVFRWLRNYAASDDPLVGAGNTIALVLAGNQPFYPLYLLGLFGSVAIPSLVQIAVTPAFALVPAVARRSGLAGRILLIVVSVWNTVNYIKIVGQQSGLELFFFPCTMLAALLFRRSERWIMLVLTTLSPVVYFALRDHYGAPWIPFSSAAYQTMRTMNTVSIATLIGFFGIVFSGVLATTEQSAQPRKEQLP